VYRPGYCVRVADWQGLSSLAKLVADDLRRLSTRGNEKAKTDDDADHQSFFLLHFNLGQKTGIEIDLGSGSGPAFLVAFLRAPK
jgi:hypothetical protein